jgi:aryl-alcohol dehydrogenase-like predicted oxidoreductase
MSKDHPAGLRPLGRTGIRVSPIGLGVMEFSGGGGLLGRAFPVIPQDRKNAIVRAALDGGVNWFDTAEMYGNGVSEESLATALQAVGATNDDVVIATKWFPLLRTAGNIPKTIETRRRFLAPYSVSLHQVHHPWGFSSPEAEMDAMADLVEAGKIRAIGVSNFNATQMRRAYERLAERGLPLASNQVLYSLLHREIETNGVMDAAKELGVTIIAYTPLASGVLTGKYHRDPALAERKPFYWRRAIRKDVARSRELVAVMEEIAAAHGATVAQIALSWVVSFHGETVVAIPAATKVSQAEQNAAAMWLQLTEEELARLDALSRPAGGS